MDLLVWLAIIVVIVVVAVAVFALLRKSRRQGAVLASSDGQERTK